MLIGVKDSQSDLEKHYKTFCGLYNLKDLVSHKGITFVAHFMKYNEI